MTKKRNNWARLVATIEWLNLTANSFAMKIGMSRCEHLYQIKRGNFGITPDLADRITKQFPEISRTWLLTGAGHMLSSQSTDGHNLPYYDDEVEYLLSRIDSTKPTGYVDMPLIPSCEIIVKSNCKAMVDARNFSTHLFIRNVDPTEITADKEYVLMLPRETMWRRVKAVKGYNITLTANNEGVMPDLTVDVTDVIQAWQVIARMDVLSF